MGWPFGGTWNGRSAADLATIAAAVFRAVNERREALTLSPVMFTISTGGTAAYPTASQLEGIPREGSVMRANLVALANGAVLSGTYTGSQSGIGGKWWGWDGSDKAVYVSGSSVLPSGVLSLSVPSLPATVLDCNFWNAWKAWCDAFTAVIYQPCINAATPTESSIDDGKYASPYDNLDSYQSAVDDAWGTSHTTATDSVMSDKISLSCEIGQTADDAGYALFSSAYAAYPVASVGYKQAFNYFDVEDCVGSNSYTTVAHIASSNSYGASIITNPLGSYAKAFGSYQTGVTSNGLAQTTHAASWPTLGTQDSTNAYFELSFSGSCPATATGVFPDPYVAGTNLKERFANPTRFCELSGSRYYAFVFTFSDISGELTDQA